VEVCAKLAHQKFKPEMPLESGQIRNCIRLRHELFKYKFMQLFYEELWDEICHKSTTQ